MSSTTPHPASLPPNPTAPWSPLFQSHMALLSSPEFTLASLSPSKIPITSTSTSTASSSAAATHPASHPTPYAPRLRTLIYRGPFAQLPPNKHYTPPNPPVYTSDMPTFTTDVRMSKIHEFFASSAGHGDVAQSQGSGGGGEIEACFWVKDASTQWRMRGRAYVLGPDIDGKAGEESSGVRTVKSEVGAGMRRRDASATTALDADWTWAKEIEGQFGNLSPGMRGSFKNPPPGTPVGRPLTDTRLALGQKIGGVEDEVARGNFRVVIIKPEVVEQLDLSEPDKARRWRFTFLGHGVHKDVELEEGEEVLGEWRKVELWP